MKIFVITSEPVRHIISTGYKLVFLFSFPAETDVSHVASVRLSAIFWFLLRLLYMFKDFLLRLSV